MPNSVFQQLNQNNFQNPQNLIKQFNEFKNNLQGNPQQIVQQLLQNGRMSQLQFNYLQQIASQFQQFLKNN